MQFLTQVPKNRTDVLPHYSRLVATLNKYMPDIGRDLVAAVRSSCRLCALNNNTSSAGRRISLSAEAQERSEGTIGSSPEG